MKRYWFIVIIQCSLLALALFNISFKPEILSVQSVGTTNWELTPKYTKTYFDNGLTRSEGRLLDTNKVGWWKTYYKNGIDKSVGEYESNEKTRLWKIFHENGELKSVGNYLGNLKAANVLDETVGISMNEAFLDTTKNKYNFYDYDMSEKTLDSVGITVVPEDNDAIFGASNY